MDGSEGGGAGRHSPERMLEESESRFRVLFEQAAVGVGLLETTSGRFVRVNRKYSEIVGYSEAELVDLDFMAITYPDDLAPDLERMERLKRGEIREFSMEKRLVRKDGSTVWVELSVSPMWAPGQLTHHHIAVVVDITERRHAQQETLRARAELESTLAALPDLLFDVDDEGRIHDYRARHGELLAVPPSVFLGKRLEDVLPPAPVAIILTAVREAIATGQSAGANYTLAIDGVERTFELSIARKPAASGRPRAIAIARDVTERVVAEERREALEAQLRQAQKMEAVGTLAGGVAHDFNNILTVISLNAGVIRRALPAKHRALEALGDIDLVVRRAKELVEQILAFSRKQPTTRVVLSMNDAVVQATQLLRATIPAGIKLELSLAPEAPRVRADPTQLQQVLINLGTNAWQAIEDGTGTIRFETRVVTTAQGARASIRVSDDGVGMTPTTVERIFEPFFTTKPPGSGSGLGLSVVHGIVQGHGGTIVVSSQPEIGTTFDVQLAVEEAPLEAPAEEPTTFDGRGARVLYVDDERLILPAASAILEHLGYRATTLADPLEALALLRADPSAFDVLITDLSMPGLSGIDLARAAHELRADLPIVLVSGYAPQHSEQLAAVGIRDRMAKPFEIPAIGRMLQALVQPRPVE